MSIRLPESFETRMRDMLGDQYEEYLKSFDRPVLSGMRLNTLKWDEEQFRSLWGNKESVAWCPEGFYASEKEKPSKHPYYYAGLYYLQEPSAMLPAAILPVEPGDKVLDLCAAPGGKSTQLLCRLQGEGLLVSNDISPSRAKALLKNLELFGGRNYVVTTEPPFKLASRFPAYFDKILVDAPCSGEGMFHKEPAIMKNWEQYGTGYYADLQREILDLAYEMLKPGGQMVYSTCTFSPQEDEVSLYRFLKEHPDMRVDEVPETPGFDHGHPEWIPDADPDIAEEIRKTIRLWPHKVRGEGHFAALLHKDGAAEESVGQDPGTGKADPAFTAWCQENLLVPLSEVVPQEGRLTRIKDFLVKEYLEPERVKGLRILRSGLLLGEIRSDRFEPSQALAMALRKEQVRHVLDLSSSDERVLRYLKGETLTGPFGRDWYLVLVDGFPLGWAKGSGNLLKNKYLKGWRYL